MSSSAGKRCLEKYCTVPLSWLAFFGVFDFCTHTNALLYSTEIKGIQNFTKYCKNIDRESGELVSKLYLCSVFVHFPRHKTSPAATQEEDWILSVKQSAVYDVISRSHLA